jgi:hypothetical protein
MKLIILVSNLIKFNIFSIKLIYFLEMLIPCFIARIC